MIENLERRIITPERDEQQPVDPKLFRYEQISMLFKQLKFIYLADCVASVFLFLILLATAYDPLALIWVAAILVLTTCRAFIWRHLKAKYLTPENNALLSRFVITGAFISGVLWGLNLSVLPRPPDIFHISLVGVWLAGLLAGAATTMSVMREVFFAFTIPASLLFFGLLLLISPTDLPIFLGGIGVFLAFIIPIAMHISSEFNKSILLKLHNQKLRQHLNADVLYLKQLEDELMTQLRKEATLQSQKAHIDAKLKAADEDRLLILDAVQEGIYGVSNSGTIMFINPSALRILEFTEEEVLGKSAAELINPTENPRDKAKNANEAITNCYRNGIAMLPVDSVFTGKDGRRFPVRFSCEPIRKERNVIGAVVSFVDISKQKEMEFMLIQSQKMEAIGRLTGGVSHDFNNLLTVIMGNLQFVQRKIGDDEQIKTLLNKIMNAAKNGAELNNRLLSFSREQALETSPTHIREMLLEMAEFLDRILGEEISLDLQLMDENCVVMTDRTQLENAILNLCVNAKDAMPQGGKLTISAKTRRLPESFMGHTLELTERDYIELQITDTGTGIPESIQRQIFEPFFTTKEKNRGTGLGLSTVYGFLRQSGGNITVKSLMGEGTTFNLYLPISTEGASTSTLINELVESEVNYTGTILVVEDDENVRDVAVNMLTEAGYVVITATDGPAGLEKFRENPEIDLVFSDVIMPGGMTGIEMAEQILQLRPELPILLTTGYTEKSLKDRILESSNIVCVPKPYDTNELPKYVNSMMHRFNHKAESAGSD